MIRIVSYNSSWNNMHAKARSHIFCRQLSCSDRAPSSRLARLCSVAQTTYTRSWHEAANVMYVDQPVGTGLSFTTKANYADNESEVCCVLCHAGSC